MEIEIIEQKILSIEDIRHEINYKTNSPSIVSYPFIVLLLLLDIFYKNFILYIIIKNNFYNYGFNWKYLY